MTDRSLHSLRIQANHFHEDAILEGDRTALTRLRDSLSFALENKFDSVYSRHFLDEDGEEYDILIRINEDL